MPKMIMIMSLTLRCSSLPVEHMSAKSPLVLAQALKLATFFAFLVASTPYDP
jgi:hypothetical protein